MSSTLSIFAYVLTGLLSLPVSKYDRAPELVAAKTVQQLETAVAIAEAVEQQERWPGSKRELAALLLAVGYAESAFAMHVGRGDFKKWEGDPLHGEQQSISFWQFKSKPRGATDPEVWAAARTDIRVAAREAARLLTARRRGCASLERQGFDWVELTVAAYSGRGCRGWFRGLELRVSTFRRLMGIRVPARVSDLAPDWGDGENMAGKAGARPARVHHRGAGVRTRRRASDRRAAPVSAQPGYRAPDVAVLALSDGGELRRRHPGSCGAGSGRDGTPPVLRNPGERALMLRMNAGGALVCVTGIG